MKERNSILSRYEVTAVLLVLLILARYYWAGEFYEWEQKMFGGYQYFITIPIFLLVAFAMFRDAKKDVRRKIVKLAGAGIFVIASTIGFVYFLRTGA